MKQTLEFKNYENADVLLASIRPREFDVRPTTSTNLNAVNEMRILGLGTRRPPYVTTDLVVIDGRHLVDAWGLATPRPTTIRVRMLPFAYDNLTRDQKAQVTAWALDANAPDSAGYREFYTTDSVIFVIKGYLKDGFERDAIKKYLKNVPSGQFSTAYRAAEASHDQSVLYIKQQEMVEKNLPPKVVARTMSPRLAKKFLQKVSGGAKLKGAATNAKAGAKAIKDKQSAIDKAYIAVSRYTDTLFNKLGEPGYSVEITERVISYHRETISNLSARFENGAAVVAKAILAKKAELSRNPNRP